MGAIVADVVSAFYSLVRELVVSDTDLREAHICKIMELLELPSDAMSTLRRSFDDASILRQLVADPNIVSLIAASHDTTWFVVKGALVP